MTSTLNKLSAITVLLLASSFQASAADSNSCGKYENNKCYYNPSIAVNSAMYGMSDGFINLDYHPIYAPYYNSNNYASQVILSGLVGHDLPYEFALEYLVDRQNYMEKGHLGWFYMNNNENISGYSDSWIFPNELFRYAKSNKNSYKGMHFDYVTHDTPREYLDTSKIKLGDIIFADWENDGKMDHTFIVTSIDSSATGYDKIKVTYSYDAHLPATVNRSLGNINISHNYKATFQVYRPTFYSDLGL